MILEEGEILTLKNKDYIVVHIIELNNKKYTYLVSDFKPLETIIVEAKIIEDNLVLLEVSDENIIKEVLTLISEH